MSFQKKPSKTSQTKERYIRIANSLWYQYLKNFAYNPQDLPLSTASLAVHHDGFLSWLRNDKHPNLVRNSWRLYNSALSYVFDELGRNDLTKSLQDFPTADDKIKRTRNTSAHKARTFSPKNFERILETLITDCESKYAFPLFCWLNCGLIFGLRPSEWATASFETTDAKNLGFKTDETYNVAVVLHVNNAKHTNGRSHGQRRQIHALLSEEQYSYLYALIEEMEKLQFDHLYHECRNLLYQINRRVFGRQQKNITLYSMRHQWNANIKADFIKKKSNINDSLEKLAAMNGHASLRTATRHYGRAKGGWASPVAPVKASESSIDQVRAKQIGKNPSLKLPDPLTQSTNNQASSD